MQNSNKFVLIYIAIIIISLAFAMQNRAHERESNYLRAEIEVSKCMKEFELSEDECYDMLRKEDQERGAAFDAVEQGSNGRYQN
ncbi:hypothetical protein [Advenella sp. FME57]|uniref:hypothetical protein n=1 Tax=Advenella sp. FME57 TaxID=2742604 RepID=UPI0018696151|nr:hypothetical protein [Advenella sp. FME57]